MLEIALALMLVQETPPPAERLSTLRPLLRHFDFEDAADAPQDMPDFFYRYGQANAGPDGARARGFPPFGEMRLRSDAAATGRWSFRFDLDGGSMAARIPTAVLPVMPGTAYRLEVRVRTEGLEHAGAALSAWAYDAHGEVIEGTEVRSRLARTGGRWEQLSIQVAGHADAVDLGVELALLQPRQFAAARLADTAPVPEDYRGRAWFDDLAIWTLPDIEIDSAAPGHVFAPGAARQLLVTARDRTSRDPRIAVSVLDLDGAVVRTERFDPRRSSRPHPVDLAGLPAGWYEARVVLSDGMHPVGARSARLLVLSGDAVPARPPRFGVELRGAGREDLALTRALGAGAAVAVIGRAGLERIAPDELREALSGLLDDGVELTAALDWALDAPPRHGADDVDVARTLDELIMLFGPRVSRWQFGTSPDPSPWAGRLERRRDLEPLSIFVSSTSTLSPRWADHEPAPGPAGSGDNLTVPWQMAPEAIAALAPGWRRRGGELLVTLERPPAGLYAPRDEAVDLARRTLVAWRAGLERLVLPAPWSAEGRSGGSTPEPAFGVWRTLAAMLDGRVFRQEIDLGEHVTVWFAGGHGDERPVLVAWTEDAPTELIAAFLGEGTVTAIDAFGNRRAVPLAGGVHRIALDDLPVFIEGVDPRLVRFRAAVALDPPEIEAAHRVHRHELVVSNPWDLTLPGVVHLRARGGWSITPRRAEILLGPGETVRLPVNVTPERGVVSGPASLGADFELSPGRPVRLHVEIPVEIGLDELEVVHQWRVAADERGEPRDVLLLVSITNRGAEPIGLDAFAYAPAIGTHRRAIGILGPGQTSRQTFHVADGVARLGGRTVHLGATERNGSRRLTRAMDIPRLE